LTTTLQPDSFFKNFNIKWLLVIVVVVVSWVDLNQERWLKKDVIAHDVAHYYSYLPAFFYAHDLSLSFLSDTLDSSVESTLYAPNRTADYHPVLKMTMGMAMTYLPFFGLAHVYCKIFGIAPNGISEPYHFTLLFCTLLYFVIGLYFLHKVLRRFFPESLVCWGLFCICFGTNVFYYLTIGAAMAHTTEFALISVFLFLMIRWYEGPQIRLAIGLGLVAGLFSLIRPTNVLLVLVFLIYQVNNWPSLTNRVKFLLKYKWHCMVMMICAFVVWLPQLLYWKYVTGQFFFHSYVGEHFYFDNPHILKAMIGFRKGWLIYTPLMAFSLFGLFLLPKRLKEFGVALPLFFIIFVYVMFSWWCWWYGGSFGQRVMIDIYPLLAIPFCEFLFFIATKNSVVRTGSYLIIGFFIFLNLFQTMQAKYNILHYDSMTFSNYKEIFFTATTKPDREKHLDHPDYKKALKGEEE